MSKKHFVVYFTVTFVILNEVIETTGREIKKRQEFLSNQPLFPFGRNDYALGDFGRVIEPQKQSVINRNINQDNTPLSFNPVNFIQPSQISIRQGSSVLLPIQSQNALRSSSVPVPLFVGLDGPVTVGGNSQTNGRTPIRESNNVFSRDNPLTGSPNSVSNGQVPAFSGIQRSGYFGAILGNRLVANSQVYGGLSKGFGLENILTATLNNVKN